MDLGGSRMSSRTFVAVAALGAALLATPAATAQTKGELDQARVSFQEGVALMAANNCAAALAKFQAVTRVRRTPQVLFNIGECEERLGKLVSALGNFRLAASAAEGDRKAKDVQETVGARIETLEGRIPKLAIRRGDGALTSTILLDGVELGAAEISAEIPVDPGPHTVVARVDDREVWRETVAVEERDSKTVEVAIEAAPVEPPPPPPVERAPDPPKRVEKRSKVPAIVALGAGVASGVVGAVFLGLRGGTLSDLDDLCGGDTTCPPSAESTADKGRLYTGIAEVTIGLGIVGVATGVVLLVTGGDGASPAPAPAPAARLGVRGVASFVPRAPGADIGGLSVVARF
jgi:hypothetical protein